MIEMMKRNSSEEAELIDFKQGNLEFADNKYKQNQDLLWLDIKQEKTLTFVLGFGLRKEMSQAAPPTKKWKENQSELEKQLINQRASSKGFLQNQQMGKAIKKDWDTDIAFVQNLFAYLLIPVNIRREYVWRKIEWDIKENTALNIIHDFLKEGHLDEEMQLLIQMNHNFYGFMNSTTINIIYFNMKEIYIQERFLEKYNKWWSSAQGGWLSISLPVNQYRCMGLPNPQVMQYPPLPNNVVVQSEKIDPASLNEHEKSDILKKQKQTLEKESLKCKIEQMDAIKRQQKIVQQDFLKNKKN